jgi:CheY-like chemotaxis protein
VTDSLGGLSVLIVEDEVIVGMMLAMEVERAGGRPIGPVSSLTGALQKLASLEVDAVILDAKLIDGSGADLSDTLDRRGIPFVVSSGYEKANLPESLKRAPFVAKPISAPLLIDALRAFAPAARPRRQVDGALTPAPSVAPRRSDAVVPRDRKGPTLGVQAK